MADALRHAPVALLIAEAEEVPRHETARQRVAIRSGTRTPSSTNCTSRRSSTATTTASATSAGLLQKLDYLQDLGVTCLWLLPFFPSPLRDDGYDICDYLERPPRLRHAGRLPGVPGRGARARHAGDDRAGHQPHLRPAPLVSGARAQAPARIARARFLRVERHRPEVQRTPASSSPTPRNPTGPGIRWRKAYYWHRFFSHQPDLNFDNPAVVEEVLKVMRFWLDMGVDGLRLDAIPYLVERDGTNCENLPETHAVIEADPRGDGRGLREPHDSGRSQPVAHRRAAVFRRRRRVPHGVPLSADAAHLHGAAAGRPPADHRHHGARRPPSRRTASGACSCATTTS